ncbi:MAG: copper amine oxidase N-terminal domain-containing protein [Eubacterium sp.]|nr:copper amine oxidase N-terminal domain-containing protein [Eubacterium sp.]
MKKTICFLALTALLSGSLTTGTFCEDEAVRVITDGKELEFDVEPDIINGVTYVAIRPVLEAFTRNEVNYKTGANGRILTAYADDGSLSVDVDRGNYLYTDYWGDYSKVGVLEHLPYIKQGRTMLPVREIIELMGGTVVYDGEKGLISINSELYEEYSDLEGVPYPIVLREVEYDAELASALTSSEGYEYLNELSAKVLEYEDNYYDSGYESDPSEYYEYLRELCYNEVKYILDLDQFGEYDEYLSKYMTSYVSGDYSDLIEIDSSLNNEESLRNLFDFLYKGEETSAAVNIKILPYARYMVLSVFGSSLTADEKDITSDFTEEFEGQSNAFVNYWPFRSRLSSSSSGDLGYIEGYIERLYRNDGDILLILDSLKAEYEPEAEEEEDDLGLGDESRKELYKEYFGENWYYYYYGSDAYHTVYRG